MLYTTFLTALFRLRYGDPKEAEAGPNSGLVIVADGVGGMHLCGMGLRYAETKKPSPNRVHLHLWGHGFGRWYSDLTNVNNHIKQAQLMADEVRAWKQERPSAPVYLVGKSGGTGVVVRVLEQLDPDTIEAAVLLAPAISPNYDLTRALTAVRREMVVFWSPYDLFVLGLGTRIFGTIDRVRSVSAGLVGFKASGPQLSKLRQVRWRPKMMRTGYFGGHVGPDSPAFLRTYVMPLLTTSPPPNVGYPNEVKPGPERSDNPIAQSS